MATSWCFALTRKSPLDKKNSTPKNSVMHHYIAQAVSVNLKNPWKPTKKFERSFEHCLITQHNKCWQIWEARNKKIFASLSFYQLIACLRTSNSSNTRKSGQPSKANLSHTIFPPENFYFPQLTIGLIRWFHFTLLLTKQNPCPRGRRRFRTTRTQDVRTRKFVLVHLFFSWPKDAKVCWLLPFKRFKGGIPLLQSKQATKPPPEVDPGSGKAIPARAKFPCVGGGVGGLDQAPAQMSPT